MRRTRYLSPPRSAVSAETFAHPAFAPFAHYAQWFHTSHWPSIAELNACWRASIHLESGQPLSFVAQTALADSLHYEARIYQTGTIATREACWHDLFNALIWLEHTALKCALNTAYVREFSDVAASGRTRAQCALTHFDEGGAIVILRDPALLDLWDQHAWQRLFVDARQRWLAAATVLVVGHALFDHLLTPYATPVAKCVVIVSTHEMSTNAAVTYVARQILLGKLLRDPQALRPLPLAALTGWHPANVNPDFYVTAPTFRPLRPGRVYPRAIAA